MYAVNLLQLGHSCLPCRCNMQTDDFCYLFVSILGHQGPTGWWAPTVDFAADEGLGLLADQGTASSPPTALNVINSVLALSACVLGPYMAMTGLT